MLVISMSCLFYVVSDFRLLEGVKLISPLDIVFHVDACIDSRSSAHSNIPLGLEENLFRIGIICIRLENSLEQRCE